MTDDATLMARMRELWERADPPPAHLADHVLFALEVENLDTEFELLRLTDRDTALAGARAARGTASEVTHITFAGKSLTVMLAVARAEDRRRIDGWIAPAAACRIVVHSADGEATSSADESGRFVLESLPAGMLRLVFHPESAPDGPAGTPFITPTVEI